MSHQPLLIALIVGSTRAGRFDQLAWWARALRSARTEYHVSDRAA